MKFYAVLKNIQQIIR